MCLLSIIIPVYNAEKYLQECLNSVFSQIDDQVEVIVINDGSTDRSENIILEFKEQYNFAYIKNNNKGISTTRNCGIMNAIGEYIIFLDSDDILVSGISNLIKSTLLDYKYDCLTFNYNFLISSKVVEKKLFDCNGFYRNLKLYPKIKLKFADVSHWYCWLYVLKREYYLENLFDEGRRFEDILLLPIIFTKINSLAILSTPIVYYRYNPYSITRNLKESDLDDSEFGMNKFIHYYNQGNNKVFWAKLIANFYISHIAKCAILYAKSGIIPRSSYIRLRSEMRFKYFLLSYNIKAFIFYVLGKWSILRLARKLR